MHFEGRSNRPCQQIGNRLLKSGKTKVYNIRNYMDGVAIN